MIVPAVPTYLSNAFPPRMGLSGCGMGYDPCATETWDEQACAEYLTSEEGAYNSGGSATTTTTTPGTSGPITINVGGGSGGTTPTPAASSQSSWQSFLQAIGIAATPSVAKAAGTAITASSLPAGYSLITNANGTQSIVSSSGTSTLLGSSTAST